MRIGFCSETWHLALHLLSQKSVFLALSQRKFDNFAFYPTLQPTFYMIRWWILNWLDMILYLTFCPGLGERQTLPFSSTLWCPLLVNC